MPLFKIVLLGLQLDYGVPQLVSLGPELLDGETIDFQGFDANTQRDFLLLLELLFRLVALQLRRREVALYPTDRNALITLDGTVSSYVFRVLRIRTAKSFLVMVKLGPFLLACSFIACIIAWRFFSDSSRRLDKKIGFFLYVAYLIVHIRVI